jgi:large subunit ribosomal protein L31
MKKNIHPEYKNLEIILGENIGVNRITTKSTLKSGKILMDVDYRKHPAWNKSIVNVVNQSNKTVSDFNKKFGEISFGIKRSS